MKLKKGDFILITKPCFGYSDSTDLGPYIVKVESFFDKGINYRHYLIYEKACVATAGGSALYTEIVAKIDDSDVKTIFKEGL